MSGRAVKPKRLAKPKAKPKPRPDQAKLRMGSVLTPADEVAFDKLGIEARDGEPLCYDITAGPLKGLSIRLLSKAEDRATSPVPEKEEDEPKKDVVNHPSHYKSSNGLECIYCQEAAVIDSPLHGFQAHLIATIIGYAFRCGKKDSALTDAEKLRWYANRLVESLQADDVKKAS